MEWRGPGRDREACSLDQSGGGSDIGRGEFRGSRSLPSIFPSPHFAPPRGSWELPPALGESFPNSSGNLGLDSAPSHRAQMVPKSVALADLPTRPALRKSRAGINRLRREVYRCIRRFIGPRVSPVCAEIYAPPLPARMFWIWSAGPRRGTRFSRRWKAWQAAILRRREGKALAPRRLAYFFWCLSFSV